MVPGGSFTAVECRLGMATRSPFESFRHPGVSGVSYNMGSLSGLNHWFFHITNNLEDFRDLHFFGNLHKGRFKIRCPKNWMVTKKEQNLWFVGP